MEELFTIHVYDEHRIRVFVENDLTFKECLIVAGILKSKRIECKRNRDDKWLKANLRELHAKFSPLFEVPKEFTEDEQLYSAVNPQDHWSHC